MILSAALLSAALSLTPDALPVITLRDKVTLRDGTLYLADVADLSVLPTDMRGRAENLALARYSRSGRSLAVSQQSILARARAMLPMLAPWLPANANGTVLLEQDKEKPSTAGLSCLLVTQDLQAGVVAASRYFTPHSSCSGSKRNGTFRYDRSRRAIVANRDMVAGDIVHTFAGAGETIVQAGDHLMLLAGVGPVVVERPVEALQGARSGQKLFVRTDDGEVISIAFVDGGQ